MTYTGSIVWLATSLLNRVFKFKFSMKLLMIPFIFFLLPIKEFSTKLIDNDPSHSYLIVFKKAAIIWAFGVLINLLYIILIALIVRYKLIQLPTCQNTLVLKTVELCSKELCINRKIKLYECQAIGNIRLYGIIKPCIIISPNIYSYLNSEELNMIFLHELNHLKNYDMLLRWFVRFISCIHWFNPIIWLAYKLLEWDCEMRCDRNVIVALKGNAGKDYARLIIKLIEIDSRNRQIPISVGFSSYNNIRMRIKGIVEPQKDTNKFIKSLTICFTYSLVFWLVISFSLSYFYT